MGTPHTTRPGAATALVIAADPVGRANPDLVVAATRAGAVGLLDLRSGAPGPDGGEAVRRADPARVGLRTRLGDVDGLTEGLTTVPEARGPIVVAARAAALDEVRTGIAAVVAAADGRDVLAEVTDRTAAVAAVEAGATGVLGVGSEAGGRIGEVESSILLQQLRADLDPAVPVWAWGGIGLHSAAAAVAGGATGVVLDGQLALVRESALGDEARTAVGAMDGSETRVVGGHRLFTRPDLEVATLPDTTTPDDVAARVGPDLRDDLLPIGADGAAAEAFARRFGTVGGVVQAVTTAVRSHLEAARTHQPLAPGHGVAASHGTRHPLAQGPMTRVSDRAAFAASVAEGGALPFLALALMGGSEVRDLLTETAERLGDRPWGVGILGFVPPEVREAQLEAVHDVAPPVALIAGGRPSQARPLEDAGIATYLHVPSPGLLDRFLKDGARRFVFEGRECGGHVGPRSSFSLWDAQIERLLADDDPSSLHVLLAGGIHDARSGAMAATAAAPLAARGAHVGALMGTAYLFTPEAVAGGAITPTFQEVAVGCTRTVLLETAPGHATRCVETDYVRAFRARRDELEAEGVEAQARWAELETLNLGRLRMASKGLTRDGDHLVELDDAAQRRDGMFMIGEVATVHREVSSVEQLHRSVSEGSVDVVDAVAGTAPARAVDRPEGPAPLDVAVVGMASFFPGAPDADAFWANVVGGVNSITEVPAERWDVDTYYDPEAVTRDAGRKTPSRWGGFLDRIGFDPLAYGIPPASLAAVEPVQLLSLEVAARALADAGYATREFDRDRASVVFGAESGNDLAGAYGFRAYFPSVLGDLPPELDAHLPAYTEDSFPGVLTNVIAGRIANRLDLGGVNYTLDAACASSLAAVDAAAKELVSGSSDLVVCGGADLHNGLNDYLLFASVHALSPTGQCRTFDRDADGIALGEGIAAVILKRRADAERDGDRIYAVLDAVAGSSDGRHLGLTAPRKEGQQRAVTRALARSGRSAAEIGLVEAHGTGTVVGDRTELATLTELYAAEGSAPGSAVVGSVKSQIGHTKCAAGLAGLIKAVRAVHHGVLPPTLNVVDPNPYWDPATSPFRLLDTARPWLDDERRAAVSAFGFGGTNFHAIVSSAEAEVAPHGLDRWPAELVLVRGASAEEARTRTAELADLVDRIVEADPRGQRHRLRDVARTACAAGEGPVRTAVVASDLADLAAGLRAALAGTDRPGVFVAGPEVDEAAPPTVAFLYPGQGSQRPGMLGDLFVAFPQLRDVLRAGRPWVDLMLPPAAFGKEARAAQREALTATQVAQPTLGMAALAMTRLLDQVGVAPAMAGGHSYGELAALAAAGAFDDATLLDLSRTRGEAITEAIAASGGDAGAMAAVRLDRAALEGRLDAWPGVVVANHNGPTQAVLSGPTAAVEAAVEALTAEGVKAKLLPVACAFHSPLVASAGSQLRDAVHRAEVGELAFPVWSNVTAAPYRDASEVPDLLGRQVAEGVRFVDQVEAMYEAGARVFVEAGPGRVLTQQVADVLGDRPHHMVATDVAGEAGLPRFLLALAELAALGVPVDPSPLFAGRARLLSTRALPAPTPGWEVDGMLTRTADGRPVAGGLQPADTMPTLSLGALGGAPPSAGADQAVLEYLRSVRELVAAERDVMLGYLGAPVTASPSLGPVEGASPAALVATATPAADGQGAAPTRAARPTGDALLTVVLELVSDRTGYPVDMLDPDLDLEADLSIDSIKRIEIIGELAEAIGLGAAGDAIDESVVEELAALKSLRAIVTWIDTSADLLGAPDAVSAPSASAAARPTGDALLTVVLELVSDRTGYPVDMLDPDLDLEADLSIDSIKRIEIIGELAEAIGLGAAGDAIDESVVEELAALKSLRAIVTWIDTSADDPGAGEAPEPAPAADEGTPDGPPVPPSAVRHEVELVDLGPVADPADLGGQRVALVVPAGPDRDRGPATLAGLLETALGERGARPEVVEVAADDAEAAHAALGAVDAVVVLTDLDPGTDARDAFAAVAAAALGAPRRLLGLVRSGGASGLAGLLKAVHREAPDTRVRAVEVDPDTWPVDPDDLTAALVAELADDRGPVEVVWRDGRRRARRVVARELDGEGDGDGLSLGDGAVVLVTGGARGITASVATALGAATGCRLVLVGSSPLPGPEDPRLAEAADAPALRQAIVGLGEVTSLPEVEATVRRTLADRQIRATLAGLAEAGVEVEYHSLDVRDGAGLTALVAEVVARHGRLDGIVHGAGVLDDHLLADKDPEAFARVFATKVDPARALLAAAPDSTRFVVLFGSISGVFGNRGQTDYGAANDALDRLAEGANRAGRRVVAVDWGPWAGGGMVSPELEREYARRGIGLVDPSEGVAALLAELAAGDGAPQVVVMRSTPEALDPDGAAALAAAGLPVAGA